MIFENISNLIFGLLFLTLIFFFWNSGGTPLPLNPKLSQSSPNSAETSGDSAQTLGFVGATSAESLSDLSGNRPESENQQNPFYLADIGVKLSNFFLTIYLLERWIESGHPPMSNLYESLLFLTWTFLTLYLIVSQRLTDNGFKGMLGMILVSPALFTYTFATWRLPIEMQSSQPLVPALQSNWLLMHVSIMLLSYGALLGGSLLAITYLVVYASISKGKESSKTLSTQSNLDIHQGSTILLNLDNLSGRTLGFAFPMLTLGILSGAVWANEAWGSYWSWDPKETWALITWFIFAIYLHVRIQRGWVGQKAAIVATLGFFFIWVCYLGVNLLGKGLHSYGWWSS
jgi:cytochrome c-type biogenesis protein CcsB